MFRKEEEEGVCVGRAMKKGKRVLEIKRVCVLVGR